jgi:hypothetical protein
MYIAQVRIFLRVLWNIARLRFVESKHVAMMTIITDLCL